MRITFVSAVPAMLGAVVWGVWDAHIASLRESWTPLAHVSTRADPPTVAAEPRTGSLDAKPLDRSCGEFASRIIAVRQMKGTPYAITQANCRETESPIDDFTDPPKSR